MQIPVAPNEYARVEAAFPFDEQRWAQFLAVLQAMKPALVTEKGSDGDDDEERTAVQY